MPIYLAFMLYTMTFKTYNYLELKNNEMENALLGYTVIQQCL